MTEAEWLTSASPNALLHHLRPWGRHRRKLQLYVCGCYRQCWWMLNEPCRQLVEACERAACGLADPGQVVAAKRAVTARARREFAETGTDGLAEVGPGLLRSLRLEHLPGWEGMPPRVTTFQGTEEQRLRIQAIKADKAASASEMVALLREVVGNPFRRTSFDPAWRTATVIAIARGVYEEGTFDLLPLLADALQDAGCDDEQVLNHCRSPGPHVRGCWALNLVLGVG